MTFQHVDPFARHSRWCFNNRIELIWKTNAFNSNWSVNALHDTRMKNTQRTVPVKQKIERKSKIKWNFRRMSNKLRKSYWNCLVKNTFYMQALWFLIFYSWLLKAEHANQQEIKHEKKNREENLNELARVGRCVFIIAYNYE